MRPSRLIPILMAVLTAAGCVHTSAPNVTAAQRATLAADAAPADLDSLAYERRVTAPSAARAEAQPQPHQPPPVTAAAMQAHAQAVVPVVPVVATSPSEPYLLDTGDKLRIVVFGQDGLSNSYSSTPPAR